VSNVGGFYNSANQTLTTTSETAVLSSTTFVENQPTGLGVAVAGVFLISAGTATTSITIQVRRGVGTSGTSIYSVTHNIAAATPELVAYGFVDPTLSGTVQYSLTITQNAATGNGTVSNVFMRVEPSTSAV
jgi:hypothetical protein